MKKQVIIVLCFFLVGLASQAQRTYSLENLQRVSQEELDIYMNKALNLQKSGKTVRIVGTVVFGTSAFILIGFGSHMGFEGFIYVYSGLAGLAIMTTGITMNVTGKKRVERINMVKNTAFNDIRIDLQPCAQYNLASHHYQPGISLKIKF